MFNSGAMTNNIESQIEDEDEDVAGGEESIDNPQNRFEDGGVAATFNCGVQEVAPNTIYVPGSEYPPVAGNGGADQLTLSFQGEVYVFDAVSPDKVHAVLLLLGGYEIPSGIPAVGGTVPLNQRAMNDFPVRSIQPQRAASLSRFQEKRKERCFDKKIRYTAERSYTQDEA